MKNAQAIKDAPAGKPPQTVNIDIEWARAQMRAITGSNRLHPPHQPHQPTHQPLHHIHSPESESDSMTHTHLHAACRILPLVGPAE